MPASTYFQTLYPNVFQERTALHRTEEITTSQTLSTFRRQLKT